MLRLRSLAVAQCNKLTFRRIFENCAGTLQYVQQFRYSTTTTLPVSHVNRIGRLVDGLKRGDRAALAESITLVESIDKSKRNHARYLLQAIQEFNPYDKDNQSFRIGISGPPGAGKSTLIDVLGLFLAEKYQMNISVLAVDPSSKTTGGSLLGDKTRMVRLSQDPRAYIRPSATGGRLGGVTQGTREAILLCEAAGYGTVFVETVGVGQSEHMVSEMVDVFVLIIPPAGGDELQAIKRGIIELADIVVINKCDGDLLPASRRVAAEYTSALKLMRRNNKLWTPPVLRVSSVTGEGLETIWETLQQFRDLSIQRGYFFSNRSKQDSAWMASYVDSSILEIINSHPKFKELKLKLECDVINGSMGPAEAAEILIELYTNLLR